MRRITFLACLSVGMLMSCAHGGFSPSGRDSAPNDRTVMVKIDNGQIKVEDPIKVEARAGAILWQLDSQSAQGYEFADNGIEFVAPYPLAEKFGCTSAQSPADDFRLPECRRQGKGNQQFRCPRWNNHRVGVCYAYSITLKPSSGGGAELRLPLDPKDPWILNQ